MGLIAFNCELCWSFCPRYLKKYLIKYKHPTVCLFKETECSKTLNRRTIYIYIYMQVSQGLQNPLLFSFLRIFSLSSVEVAALMIVDCFICPFLCVFLILEIISSNSWIPAQRTVFAIWSLEGPPSKTLELTSDAIEHRGQGSAMQTSWAERNTESYPTTEEEPIQYAQTLLSFATKSELFLSWFFFSSLSLS